MSPFKGIHGLIPFQHISKEDYEPAIVSAIAEHDREIDAIVAQQDTPSFKNTIVALEKSGQALGRVLGVFYPMLSADADESMIDISNRMAPLLSEHSNNVMLNRELWHRIKAVNDSDERNLLDAEDAMLLKRTVEAFVRAGASLDDESREQYRDLTRRLTELTLRFEQNVLRETARGEMWLNASELDGLPQSAIDAAAMQAKSKGRDDEYLITLQAPSYGPFMKYSSRRDLRERIYKMYNTRCTSGEDSNMDILREIANTRLAIARLLGYPSFAEYRLVTTMAERKENVLDMLNRLRLAYSPVQQSDMEQLKHFACQIEGYQVDIKPWDFAYYSNKLRESLFNIDDERLKPYFELSRVIEGVFGLATRLYGLHFIPCDDAPVYHPEVKVYDVTDADGQYMGTLYTDFFPRDTKQGGAWMTNFREQYGDVRPLVSLCMNFTRPTADKPSLLTFGEVRTFMHEFGHGLHSLLSKTRYESLSGTNVYRDFVEMPSQFNENFIYEREFLDSFARHYITGEPVPQELIDNLIAAAQFQAAYGCIRQLGFGFLDMAWHTITEPFEGDVLQFEHEAMSQVQVFEPVPGCAMSPQFTHIFSGGYAAGYYGYKWAEVLDADAFEKFKQDGVFNTDTAHLLRDTILSRGGTAHPMTLYRNFRGQEPTIDALMRRDGITLS